MQLQLTSSVLLPQRWSCCPELSRPLRLHCSPDANVYAQHVYIVLYLVNLYVGVEFWTFFGLKDGQRSTYMQIDLYVSICGELFVII